ncbi:MAG: UbiX family flavin prenyltransferase [Thermoprotei archaeon]
MVKRLLVCITGSTGSVYGQRLLMAARESDEVETSLVITKSAKLVIAQELGIKSAELESLADHVYNETNFMAPIASGSYRLDATVIAPCSMKTLAGIAVSYEENLVVRAGSVALKEKWPLILLVRETPLSVIHLKNMLTVAEAGGIIMPPLPPLYFGARTTEEQADLIAGRILTMIGVKTSLKKEWGTDAEAV